MVSKASRRASLCLVLAFAFPTPQTAHAFSRLARTLQADMGARPPVNFEPLLETWKKRHGTEAAQALLEIARDQKAADPQRYIAIMGAARLGGARSGQSLSRLVNDHSWMIRSAAIQAISTLREPRSARAILRSLARDKALVVRWEAVAAIERLRPPGAVSALISAIHDPRNYHAGKALWVPQRALNALVALNAKEAAAHLLPLLDRERTDPALVAQAQYALRSLTGRQLSSASEWKAALRPVTSSPLAPRQ